MVSFKTHHYVLCLLVVCVEGSGEGVAVCVVHVDVECVVLWVAAMQLLY